MMPRPRPTLRRCARQDRSRRAVDATRCSESSLKSSKAGSGSSATSAMVPDADHPQRSFREATLKPTGPHLPSQASGSPRGMIGRFVQSSRAGSSTGRRVPSRPVASDPPLDPRLGMSPRSSVHDHRPPQPEIRGSCLGRPRVLPGRVRRRSHDQPLRRLRHRRHGIGDQVMHGQLEQGLASR